MSYKAQFESHKYDLAKGMNRLSTSYDFFASILSLGAVGRTTMAACRMIGRPKNLLVVGGGSGRHLEALIQRSGHTTYLELSNRMIEISQQRFGSQEITFLYGDEKILEGEFDVILLPFVLNSYDQTQLHEVLVHLKQHLTTDGLIAISDFNPNAGWLQRLYRGFLYWGFRILTGAGVTKLVDYLSLLESEGFEEVASKSFLVGNYRASVFMRIN